MCRVCEVARYLATYPLPRRQGSVLSEGWPGNRHAMQSTCYVRLAVRQYGAGLKNAAVRQYGVHLELVQLAARHAVPDAPFYHGLHARARAR